MREEDRRAAVRLADAFGLVRSSVDLEGLRELYGHFGRLPYENLTKLLRKHSGNPPSEWPRLPEDVVRDYLAWGAGGTCFSLTRLLEALLLDLGFPCYPVLADMSHGTEIHCALVVELCGKRFLLDPSYLLPAPMELPSHGSSKLHSPANLLLLARDDDNRYRLYTQKTGQPPKRRYTFTDQPAAPGRFEERWIDSFSQTMMNSLVMTTLSADRQLYLHNNRLQEVTVDSRRTTALRHEFAAALNHIFGMDASVARRAHEVWLATRNRPQKQGSGIED